MVWRNMNHLKHFETNYIWIYKALRNTWVQREPLTSDSSLTKSIYKRGVNIRSSCNSWKGFFSSLPSRFWTSFNLFFSIIQMTKCCNSHQSANMDSQWGLHVKSQLFPQFFPSIYSSKEFLFRAIIFTIHCQEISINFHWLWRERRNTGSYNFGKIQEKGKDSM